MSRSKMRGTALLLMMLILPFDGCALEGLIFGDVDAVPAAAHYSTYAYSASFRFSDNEWVGRSRDELVNALGPPDFIYEARPKFTNYWQGGIPAYTYVYARRDGSIGRCIDAYVVAAPTSTVIKYYCR